MKQTNLDRRLLGAIDELLTEFKEGLSEYDLITLLDQRHTHIYPKPDLSDPLLLFQHHFFLRHSLYVLQNELSQLNQWMLDITAVKITKRIAFETTNDPQITLADPLRAYYLDLSNLNKESQQSVQSMLKGFWVSMAKYQHKPEALAALGLTGNESAIGQKKQYKALVQQHHPDKGGSEEEFKKIQTAWEQIKPETR